MKSDIILDVIGNTTPFSLMGESSGYMITVHQSRYLLECGAPVFPTLGFHGLREIKGIFVSHSHDDHRRWFTDIVLFLYYIPGTNHRLKVISSEPVLNELHKNSKAALERSLSHDSRKVVDIPYEDMVDEIIIGPKARYFLSLEYTDGGGFYYQVKTRDGSEVGPEKAKIIINPKANRPRLLLKDDESGEWIEPDSFYPFSATTYYEDDRNTFVDEDAGLVVEAVKSPVWHGVPTTGYKFKTSKNSLLFSADTVYKPSLWKELCETYRPQTFKSVSADEFEKRSVIFGDINDFIERTWSRQRYEAAMSAYKGSTVIHDVARNNSVVHTDYPDIAGADIENLIFTHCPDNLTACRPILKSGKKVFFREGQVYESVDGLLHPFDADVYMKHFACYLVGYKSDNGVYQVIERNGLLGIGKGELPGRKLMDVDLYEDLGGKYFPLLEDPDKCYRMRSDGRVEVISVNEHSSQGKVVPDARGKIRNQAS